MRYVTRGWGSAGSLIAAALLVAGLPSAGIARDGLGLDVARVSAGPTGVGIDAPGAPAYAPDRVIVRFRDGTTFLPGTRRTTSLVGRANVHLAVNPPGLSVAETLGRYRRNPNVLYAEPDYTVRAALTPNDPLYASGQWDMAKIGAPAAWDSHTDSSSVVVAVVDTGIDFTHPDLVRNLWSSPSNALVHGYTCMNGACVAGGQDDHGHGTHVAGTIGASGDDSTGVTGINWKVQLLAVKFLSASGSGSTSDAVLGFDLLRSLKISGVNIRVTNNSWGGGGYSQALKDAMAALEVTPGYPGTIDVCAAGNSGLNADVSPMYPGAYDNRGILSVLATDSADAAAGFTNYGMSSVDLAAPGVGILSTVPKGTCSLCDPSGYRSLSGTSMASPHVAGVAVAILAEHPSLTAAQARDALLRPASYAPLTNARARTTSSGGRLDFPKALANAAFYADPTLNAFPSVTAGPDIVATAGDRVEITSSASDPDGDALRSVVGRGSPSAGSAWLFGWALNNAFPATAPFTAPSLARTGAMPYDTMVADDRGGGAFGRTWAVVQPSASAGGAPSGVLTVRASASVGDTVPISFVATDPEGGTVAWDVWISRQGGSSGVCCLTGSSYSYQFTSAGVYRIGVQAIDRELNLSPMYTSTITVGDAVGVGPIAEATLSVDSGPAPLSVAVDMTASRDPDGTVGTYFIGCGGSFTAGTKTGIGTCTFTTPGVYWLLLQVQDSSGLMGLTSRYVVVTPPGTIPPPPPPPDTTPPTVEFTSPAVGATALGGISVAAAATDGTGSGVKEVEFYLDAVDPASSLVRQSSAPFEFTWDTTAVAAGSHTLYAVARDVAGNTSSIASRGVTVTKPVMPSVEISPAGTIYPKRKARVALSALVNTPTYGISKVEFYVGGALLCTDTTASYGCSWQAPNAARITSAWAVAYDARGNVASSSVLRIEVR